MKKLVCLTALGLVCGAMTLSAQSKFDPQGASAISFYKAAMSGKDVLSAIPTDLPFNFNPSSRSQAEGRVIAMLAPGTSAADVAEKGYNVVNEFVNSVVIEGTIDQIITLEDYDGVKFVSFDAVATPLMDNARVDTGVDKVHAGTGFTQAYTGKGVIAGIFDIGFDPNHINFRQASGATRITTLYHYYSAGYTNIYDASNLNLFETDTKTGTHGTHTSGCMFGSYRGPSSEWGTGSASAIDKSGKAIPYYGVAYEAELYPACGQLYASSYIDYLKRMKNVSQTTGKPVVVNFSFGSIGGVLDPTYSGARQIDQYAQDIPVFISAGNDGEEAFSIQKTFTASDNILRTFIWPGNGKESSTYKGNIELFMADNRPVKVTFFVYDSGQKKKLFTYDPISASGTNVTYASSDRTGSGYITNSNFDRVYSNSFMTITTGVDAASNRYYMRANCDLTFAMTNSARRYVVGMEIEGEEGQHLSLFNGTVYNEGGYSYRGQFYSKNVAGYTSGTAELSINNLACGNHAIVIGSHNTRSTWPTLNGTKNFASTNPVNEISYYSSYGILHDGRTLPHVTAPGAYVISSISTYYPSSRSEAAVNFEESKRNNYYAGFQGTSMSSPVAAGIGVLMLQANPSLRPCDIRDILIQTATKDSYVNNGPAARWGAGKINAYEAVKEALKFSGINDITADNGQNVLVSPVGYNLWEVCKPGADNMQAAVYSLSGQMAGSFNGSGDTLTLDASNLSAGVYIVRVNGSDSVKIVVK